MSAEANIPRGYRQGAGEASLSAPQGESRRKTAKMTRRKVDTPSVFDRIKSGLKNSIAFSKGTLSLTTTELPAPPPKTGPEQVVGIRKRLRMSQAVFAATLNVSKHTVQS